jgi:quinolinate synthase
MGPEIHVDPAVAEKARLSTERMLTAGKRHSRED